MLATARAVFCTFFLVDAPFKQHLSMNNYVDFAYRFWARLLNEVA